MPQITKKIVKHLGILKTQSSGWTKELNLVSWNKREAKYDIRDWSEDHELCGKGITFDEDEAELLLDFLSKEFNISEEDTDNF